MKTLKITIESDQPTKTVTMEIEDDQNFVNIYTTRNESPCPTASGLTCYLGTRVITVDTIMDDIITCNRLGYNGSIKHVLSGLYWLMQSTGERPKLSLEPLGFNEHGQEVLYLSSHTLSERTNEWFSMEKFDSGYVQFLAFSSTVCVARIKIPYGT